MTMERGFHDAYRNIGGKVTPETENVQHLARDRTGKGIRPNHNMARTLLQLPLLIIKPDGTFVSPPPNVGGTGPGGSSSGGAPGSTVGKSNAGKSVGGPRVRFGTVRLIGGAVGTTAAAMVVGYFWNKYVQGVHNNSLELTMTREIQPKIDAVLDEYFTKRKIAKLQVNGVKAYANVTTQVYQAHPDPYDDMHTPRWPVMTLENVVVSDTKIDRETLKRDGKGDYVLETKSWEVSLSPLHDGEYVLDNVDLSGENYGLLNAQMLHLEYKMVNWLTEPYGRGTRTDEAR
jgi:hypothetical protein